VPVRAGPSREASRCTTCGFDPRDALARVGARRAAVSCCRLWLRRRSTRFTRCTSWSPPAPQQGKRWAEIAYLAANVFVFVGVRQETLDALHAVYLLSPPPERHERRVAHDAYFWSLEATERFAISKAIAVSPFSP
jgi:hypothetical protein